MARESPDSVKKRWQAVRKAEARQQKLLEGLDVDVLVQLVLMQASKSAQEDLKAIMAGMKAIAQEKAKLRDAVAAIEGWKRQEPASPPALLDPDSFAAALISSQVAAMTDEVKHDMDQKSELAEMESLRLQMAMDRMSKMMSILSNLLKKISDTSSGIVQNLK